jgi:Ca2+-binding EF-hand superfamily protein
LKVAFKKKKLFIIFIILEISRHSNSISYNNFVEWLNKNHAIQGFNLTENLVQEFFASLDPHKKGYLSENDWENAFSSKAFYNRLIKFFFVENFNWKDQKISELRSNLQYNFNDALSAFRFFKKNNDEKIEVSEFIRGISNLLPNRFTSKEVRAIFNSISGGESTLDFPSFEKDFFENISEIGLRTSPKKK